ncbi:MAG: hypothetical protein IJQ86_01275 [Spirochaetia bacterium]|nr:hypothetical protein [Spirochaetia bacterium]
MIRLKSFNKDEIEMIGSRYFTSIKFLYSRRNFGWKRIWDYRIGTMKNRHGLSRVELELRKEN